MAFKDSLRAFIDKQNGDYDDYSADVKSKSIEQLVRDFKRGSLGKQRAAGEELKRRGYKFK